jgi:hypothetical protein
LNPWCSKTFIHKILNFIWFECLGWMPETNLTQTLRRIFR